MASHRAALLLAVGALFLSSVCLAQVPNDVGAGGSVGSPVVDPGDWRTLCQHKTPDKSFTLTFTWGWFNGLTDHEMIGVNGQFPGPLLVFNENDCVAITVNNKLARVDGSGVQDNSTIHFHGQHFRGAVWSDGVPGVTQCLIPYAATMTYYWVATAVGTSWYHGHYDGQYTSGLFGPYIVLPNQKSPYMTNVDAEWIAMLSDGYTNDYKTLINFVMSPLDFTGEEPLPNYLLMNGFQTKKLAFDATKGKKILLRLINSAALTMYKFSIDGIVMQVVEIDGSAVQPYTVSDVAIHVAQRISVIIDLAANDVSKLNAVWMRFDNSLMQTERIAYEYNAVISFTGASTPQYFRGRTMTSNDIPSYSTIPTLPATFLGNPVVKTSAGDWNMLDAQNVFPVAAPPPTNNIQLVISFATGGDGIYYSYFSGITYNQLSHHMQYPSLYEVGDNAAEGALELPLSYFAPNPDGSILPGMSSFVYNIPKNAVVDVLINNTDTGSHPIHFHGYRFWMIDSDQNSNASTKASYLLRDVATAAPLGWTRFRFVANNPGTWIMHCHIDWHFEEGLATILSVDPMSFITDPMPAPAEHQQICNWWQQQESAAFAAAVLANSFKPSTSTVITAADAAPYTFIANFIICIESVFALAIYKMGIMYSVLFDLVALNVGTLLGVCWIELEHELWLKVANQSLKYEVVCTLILLGAMLPYVFEKFVKRGRANKFAWLKQSTQQKAEPASIASNSSGTDQPPAVEKPVSKHPAITVTSPADESEANNRVRKPSGQTPRATAASVDGDDEGGNLIRIHAASVPGTPRGTVSDEKVAAAKNFETDGAPKVEVELSNTAALASPSQGVAKAVQMPADKDDTKAAVDEREGDGITLDPTKHGEYKLAKAAAQEMDVILIIVMLAGDMLHNFVDGSIVASAFLTSNAIGLATSLGIFMEELPHLIGTFAVFMHAGAPIWKAVALSTFGASPFLLGGALIIGVASDTSVDRTQISYLLAFAIGSFLYITLADLVPVLTTQWNGGKRAVIQTLCILVGIGMQAGIAVYNLHEGEDAHAFTSASGGTFDPT